MKSFLSNSPTLLTYLDENIDDSDRMATIFNNYFTSIGEKTQAKIKHSHKNYTYYLT